MVVVRVNSEGSGAVLGLCVLMGVRDKGKLQVLIAVKYREAFLRVQCVLKEEDTGSVCAYGGPDRLWIPCSCGS